MTNSHQHTAADVLFAGPGEIRGVCRSIDWATTSLGEVGGWPRSLQSAVRTCLDSRMPMAVFGGPELVLIYNEGCRPFLCPSRHPRGLGRTAPSVCSELWGRVGAEVGKVFQHGESTVHENEKFVLQRGDAEEESFFTYSFTPIQEGDGRIVGVLGVFIETTEAVRARVHTEEFLAFALATARTGAWDLDLADRTARRSIQNEQIFGCQRPLPQWTYARFLEQVIPEDRQEVDRRFQCAIEVQGDWSSECRIRRSDGEIRWIWVAGRHRRDAGGHPRMAGVVQDITDRKRAEEALRASQARQAFLLMLSDALRPLSDPRAIKAAAAEVLGKTLNVAAAGYVEVEPDEDKVFADGLFNDGRMPRPRGWHRLSEVGEGFRAVLRSGQELYVEHFHADSRKAGSAKAHSVGAAAAIPLIKNGRLVACFYAVHHEPRTWLAEERVMLREVAERTWDAVERARAEQALRESEVKYRSLFNSIDEGFNIIELIVDDAGKPMDFRILEINPAHEKLTGRRDSVGRRIREILPDIEDVWIERFGRVALTGEPVRFEDRTVGIDRWFDVYASRIDGEDSRKIAVVFNDITHRKRAEQELREADRRKSEFLAVLSHELRNPLTPIRNSLYILDRAAPGGDQARRAREVIERQIDQLTHLVDDLLDITRISRGMIQLQRRRLELNELVRRTFEDHRTLFENSELQVSLEPAPQQVFIHADRNRVAQIVSNLLQNAAKFTPPAGQVSVSVWIEPGAQQAVIRVADTGTGMAPEVHARLFEPFLQADTTLDRSKGGLGLGLALVKGLVEQHGGTIEARSEGLGRGSEFTVRLPLDLTEPVPAGHDRAPAGNVRRRVLVIEDNVDAADSLREVLELDGHEVAVAYNGSEGIARALEFHPEVVLCDIGLPGMDGYAVARALRAEDALRDAHLVALSGYTLPVDVQRSAEAGFEQHLAKPPSLEKLASVLGSH